MPERYCERQSQCICVRDREEPQRLRYVSFYRGHFLLRSPSSTPVTYSLSQSAAEEGDRMEGASRTAVWGHAVSHAPGTRGRHRQRAVGLVRRQ